jgi:hypothetical protein
MQSAKAQIYEGLTNEMNLRTAEDPFEFEFTSNLGQLVDVDKNLTPSIRFYSIGSGESYFIGNDTIFCFNSRYDKETDIDSVAGFGVTFPNKLNEGYEAYNPTGMMSHFYLPHATLMDVESYNTIKQNNIWNDVDLTINGNGQLEYLFKAKDIAAFNQIRMKFDGIVGDIEDRGEGFKINTVGESTIYDKVIAYQIIEGEARVLSINRNHSSDEFWFDVTQTLHDDSPIYLYIGRIPTYVLPAALYWSTYIKSSDFDYAMDVVVDANENVYFGGMTQSQTFPLQTNTQPVLGIWITNHGGLDGIIGKFDYGRKAVWKAIVGGSSFEWVTSLALDNAIGNDQTIAVVGKTGSSDFMGIASSIICATCPGYKDFSSNGDEDGFILRFYVDGTYRAPNLNLATYFGGGGTDQINAVVFDDDNNLYIGGRTRSIVNTITTTIPLLNPNATQFFMDDSREPNGWQEGFLAKFDGTTQNLVWSTLFGGQSSPPGYDLDEVTALTIKSGYNLIVYGVTGDPGSSTNVFGPLGGVYTGTVFPLRLFPGNASCYIAASKGYLDCFLAEFTPQNQLKYSTMFGGTNDDNLNTAMGNLNDNSLNTLLKDPSNNIWIGGLTRSNVVGNQFPLFPFSGNSNAFFQNNIGISTGNADGFIAKFSSNYNLQYCTYWGGQNLDGVTGIAKVGNNIVVTGNTFSNNLSTSANNNKFTYFEPLFNRMAAGPTNSSSDGFLFTLNNTNLNLEYSSYFGGNGDDRAVGLANYPTSDHLFLFGNSGVNPSAPIIGNNFPFKNIPGTYDYFYAGKGVSDLFITDFQLSCLNCPREGTNELIQTNKLRVYPNPTTSQIQLYGLNDLNSSTLKIYNMQGKLCYQINQPQNFDVTINVENWANGIYLLSIERFDNSLQSTKFCIER